MSIAVASQLKATDRCDRCGAQAYVRVSLVAGGELLFCAHHARAHEVKLRPLAIEWVDETSRLTLTPEVASDDER